MNPWRRLVGDRPIVTRLVVAVAGTMTVVLLLGGAFVFWRVQYALDRQLDQDLKAYQEVVQRSIATGDTPPSETPGQSYQIYDTDGQVLAGNATVRLVGRDAIEQAAAGDEFRQDVGRLLPAASHPYRVVARSVETPDGPVVVAAAISRHKHDEALRELLLQLAIADLVTLAAAAAVGYGTARAALNPVERYRVAAEQGGGPQLLPVAPGRDDEITRLGHTFNALLMRVREANERERQFLADASHELRSPLALMRTELEWALLKPRASTETTTALESLRTQVERLITLSNALLELEEVRASGVACYEEVHVDRLVADVVSQFAGRAAEAGRTIEARIPAGLSIDANRHWVQLALENLVSNALRHGAGTILVTASQGAGHTRIAVRDDGAGFSTDFVDKAFDRFARADPSRATRGTGLGLALVLAVAEAHGGTASIQGAGVTLDLPSTLEAV